MNNEELQTLTKNSSIYVLFHVEHVDAAKGLIFGVLPRELQEQREKGDNIIPVHSLRAQDISFAAPETRRPFKEWDVVRFRGLPYICSRAENKRKFVALEGLYETVPAAALTLLLPAELAFQPKERELP